MRALLALTMIMALAGPAAADTPKPAQAAAGDKEKLICRREVPIGSLIATRKRCMTKSQWEATAATGNEEARRAIEMNQGRPTTN